MFAPAVYARIREAERQLNCLELEGRISEQLQSIVQNAVLTLPFWRERFQAAGIDPNGVREIADLAALPILDKQEVRANLRQMVAPGTPLSAGDMTGGSTAAPMPFYRDAECLARRVANEWAFFAWYGRRPWHRWGHIWGSQRDLGETASFKSRWRARLMDRAMILPANRLSNELIDRYLERLCRFRPHFIHAYSQAAYLVARRMTESGVKVPGIAAVTVTAEPIYSDQRAHIERAFGCRVYSIYGTREFGMIAAESPVEPGLHVNPLNALVEVILPDGSPAPPGVPGQVVVTDMLNRAMPLIRYRIGDVAAMIPDGTTRLPRLDIVAGRETDFVVTPDGRFISGAALTLISCEGISQIQYLQHTAAEVKVRYVRDVNKQKVEIQLLRDKIKNVVGNGVDIHFEEVPEIPILPSGKIKYVESEVSRKLLAVKASDACDPERLVK